ncbi:hypothetical protein EDB86DRAFT_1606456 [Lactarius hatsudake]|nr:hypothetical protein EDB86DRAFT_1606456 [Lactarius hatsudake]
MPDRAIIFKDVGGKLEGEGIIAKDIQGTPNLWRREEPTPRVIGPTICPAIPGDLPPEEWKQLVRNALKYPNISIRISTKATSPQSQDDWVLSPPGSPTIPTPVSQARSFSTTQTGSTGASSGATSPAQLTALRIPEPSPGPLSAASFETARSTHSPVPQTPQTVTPSVTQPPFAPPSTLSRQKPSVAVPPPPEKPIPVPQNPPPQALFLPSVVPLKPEPPPQKTTPATATTLIFSRTLTAGGVSTSPPNTSLSSFDGQLSTLLRTSQWRYPGRKPYKYPCLRDCDHQSSSLQPTGKTAASRKRSCSRQRSSDPGEEKELVSETRLGL